MGDELEQYRARIGCFAPNKRRKLSIVLLTLPLNSKRICRCIVGFLLALIILSKCGDVESNPGPSGPGRICAACYQTQSNSEKTSFFSFPVNRAHEWASIIGRNDMIQHSPEYVNKNFFLCGHHFDEHMFRNVKKNRLVVDAVPNPKAPVMSVRLVEDGNGSIQTTSIALSTTTSLLTFPVQLFYKSSDCRPTNDACRQPTQDHLEQKQATSDDCNPERVRN